MLTEFNNEKEGKQLDHPLLDSLNTFLFWPLHAYPYPYPLLFGKGKGQLSEVAPMDSVQRPPSCSPLPDLLHAFFIRL